MTAPIVRIPNLPLAQMVDDSGNATVILGEMTFRQTLD